MNRRGVLIRGQYFKGLDNYTQSYLVILILCGFQAPPPHSNYLCPENTETKSK